MKISSSINRTAHFLHSSHLSKSSLITKKKRRKSSIFVNSCSNPLCPLLHYLIKKMKQKIVIRLSMNDEKSRSKALKTVVGASGVESVALTGAEKNQVEVVGDGIDAAVLTRALRKNVAPADLVSVGEVKKPEEKKAETPALPSPVVWSYFPQNVSLYPYYY